MCVWFNIERIYFLAQAKARKSFKNKGSLDRNKKGQAATRVSSVFIVIGKDTWQEVKHVQHEINVNRVGK